MKNIDCKNGYQLNITGPPATHLQTLDNPDHLALLPEKIPFIKPRLKVKQGDRVQLGSILLEDKRNPDIRLLSPGGGEINEVKFGPRRVIQEIIIKLDNHENTISFGRYSEIELDKLSRNQLVQAIIDGGLWPLFRELPYRDYPQPDTIPPAIYVTLGNLEPFQPEPSIYLAGREQLFHYGIKVLSSLTDGKVIVTNRQADTTVEQMLKGVINITHSGPYPAHDPGTLLYRTKTTPDQNRAWYIDGQNLLLLASLLQEGTYPTERTVVLAGSGVSFPRHIKTRLGVPLSSIVGDDYTKEGLRYIQGGVLTGYQSSKESYLGLFETALNLLPEGDHKGDLLSLMLPGFSKASFSKAFLSTLNRAPLDIDCNIHGGDRACIACGYCTNVCQVDILPQFTYKAILADEIEDALEHGLLDCVECGLCSYVCPAKIELMQTFKDAKAAHYKEEANT